MKEMWKKYKRQIQIGGGICLIAALGLGGYVVANQDADVQTKVEAKQETQSSNQKIAKTNSKDPSSDKKMDTKQEDGKKTDTKSEKTAEKKETIEKKSENSDNKNSVEKSDKKESVKAEKETGKTESSSKPEQKPSQPESKPEQKPSQPESKPEQNPSKPQTKPESKPEQKPSKPQTKPEQKPNKPQHTHTWQEVTHTIHHEEVGHNEQYVIKEAWTETVTEDVYDPWECCNVCGADCTADPSGHMKQHALAGEGGGRHTEYYKTVTRTVEHQAEYGTRWVVDQPAWTETVSDGFFCSGCGTKK